MVHINYYLHSLNIRHQQPSRTRIQDVRQPFSHSSGDCSTSPHQTPTLPQAPITREVRPPSQPIAGHSGVNLSSQTTGEADIGRTEVLDQPRQKSSQDPIATEKSWAQWHVPVIPAGSRKPKIGGLWFRPPRQKWDQLQNNQTKNGWCVAQVVDHLTSKCEALSSKPRTHTHTHTLTHTICTESKH
jgi:hypothetical protein